MCVVHSIALRCIPSCWKWPVQCSCTSYTCSCALAPLVFKSPALPAVGAQAPLITPTQSNSPLVALPCSTQTGTLQPQNDKSWPGNWKGSTRAGDPRRSRGPALFFRASIRNPRSFSWVWAAYLLLAIILLQATVSVLVSYFFKKRTWLAVSHMTTD